MAHFFLFVLINLCIKLVYILSELPQPIKIRPRMYVRRSIMYEKAAFCSPEEYNSVARQSVPLKFDKLCFLQEFYSQVNKA